MQPRIKSIFAKPLIKSSIQLHKNPSKFYSKQLFKIIYCKTWCLLCSQWILNTRKYYQHPTTRPIWWDVHHLVSKGKIQYFPTRDVLPFSCNTKVQHGQQFSRKFTINRGITWKNHLFTKTHKYHMHPPCICQWTFNFSQNIYLGSLFCYLKYFSLRINQVVHLWYLHKNLSAAEKPNIESIQTFLDLHISSTFYALLNPPTVVVKRQAEEVGKRAPEKLRAQGNYKHKTRARLKKRARK